MSFSRQWPASIPGSVNAEGPAARLSVAQSSFDSGCLFKMVCQQLGLRWGNRWRGTIVFSLWDLQGNTRGLKGDVEYVLEEKKGPAHVEVVSAVYGTVIVCVCVDVCVGGWSCIRNRGVLNRRAQRRTVGKARQRQRENEPREGSNNREQLLSCAPLMSAGNSCFGVLMTDGCFLLWIF